VRSRSPRPRTLGPKLKMWERQALSRSRRIRVVVGECGRAVRCQTEARFSIAAEAPRRRISRYGPNCGGYAAIQFGSSSIVRSRYRVNDFERAHFVTSTIVGWLPVFTTAACCDILVGSFDYCRRHKQLRLYAWVVMENHFHAIVAAESLSDVMADLKKFTARSLVEQLHSEGRHWLLGRLEELRQPHKTRSRYQVWQEGFHPQAILDDAMMVQKLDYIHHNPLRRGWVSAPEHWRYSSAHERLEGSLASITCDPWE